MPFHIPASLQYQKLMIEIIKNITKVKAKLNSENIVAIILVTVSWFGGLNHSAFNRFFESNSSQTVINQKRTYDYCVLEEKGVLSFINIQ
jgi:hypothetical protein